jgi:4-hydroxy-3-methylbut-2-enyl diphosphate reductase
MVKITVARHAGYCMGVHKAFEDVFSLRDDDGSIAVFGDMVHNRFALDKLVQKKIMIEKSLQAILDNPDITTVVIRAHGIPPAWDQVLRESGKRIVDLTCPIVKKVQQQAAELSGMGKTVIIFGKENHPEVIGIRGFVKGDCHIIRDLQDAKRLGTLQNAVLISQTTMNSIQFEKISTLLMSTCPGLEVRNTLCGFPVKTQDEAEQLAHVVDIMFVIGDRSSANTMTLFEKVSAVTRSWFVETYDDVPVNEIEPGMTIGLAGGSSTPLWQIEEVRTWLETTVSDR